MLKRALGAPLWCHAIALAVMLVALLPLARPGTVFFADEGSGLAQAQQLANGDGWSRPRSFPAADPDNATFPLFNSATGDVVTPLGQHPTYAVVLEPWYAAAGTTGAALLSLLGLVVAASLGACIARRIRPGIEIASLWAIGIASPLFFDGYLVVAHTIAAACTAGLVLALLRARDGEQRALMAAIAIALGVAAGLLRNEAVLFAAAFGLTLAVDAVRRRQGSLIALGIAVAASGEAARLLDATFRSHLLPSGAGSAAEFTVNDSGSWIGSHVDGAFVTLLVPSYGRFDVGDVLLLIGVVCALAAALVARRRPEDRSGFLLFGGLAVACVVGRLVFAGAPVPGIVWACPLLGVAVVLCSRNVLRARAVAVLGATLVLFAGAVLLTQYGAGGGREWGWRYVAIALPVAIPLAVLCIVDGAARLDARDRRVGAQLLVAFSVAVAALSFLALRETRAHNRDIVDGIRASYQSTPAADGGKPVVVTTQWGTIDRFSWDTVDETRWLVIAPTQLDDVGVYLDRIAHLGVGQLTFVTSDLERDKAVVAAHGTITGERDLPDHHVALVVRLRS